MKLSFIVVLALALAPAQGASAQQTVDERNAALEREARQIEACLIAPCCFTQQVSLHQSEAAEQVRQDIRARLRAGQKREAILQAYVDRYGTRILVEPRMEGLGLLLVVVPAVLLVVTAWGLAVVVRRSAQHPTFAAPAADAGAASLSQRLDDELRDLD
jgi:cytochrome c-type biogenesis protein CcmH